jgi:hypothetical protein
MAFLARSGIMLATTTSGRMNMAWEEADEGNEPWADPDNGEGWKKGAREETSDRERVILQELEGIDQAMCQAAWDQYEAYVENVAKVFTYEQFLMLRLHAEDRDAFGIHARMNWTSFTEIEATLEKIQGTLEAYFAPIPEEDRGQILSHLAAFGYRTECEKCSTRLSFDELFCRGCGHRNVGFRLAAFELIHDCALQEAPNAYCETAHEHAKEEGFKGFCYICGENLSPHNQTDSS